jgi:hypothetical protein
MTELLQSTMYAQRSWSPTSKPVAAARAANATDLTKGICLTQ